MTAVAPLCVDVKQAAVVLGVSVWVVRRYIEDGILPTVKFPSVKYPGQSSRRVLIAVTDLDAFVAKYRQGAVR